MRGRPLASGAPGLSPFPPERGWRMDAIQARRLAAMRPRGTGKTRAWGAQPRAGCPRRPRAGSSTANHRVHVCCTRARKAWPGTWKPQGRPRWAQRAPRAALLRAGAPHPLFTMFTSAGERRGEKREGEGIRAEGRGGGGGAFLTPPPGARVPNFGRKTKYRTTKSLESQPRPRHTVGQRQIVVEWVTGRGSERVWCQPAL